MKRFQGDRIGTRGRVNSARQSDVNRKPSGTFEDTPALVRCFSLGCIFLVQSSK